MKTIIGCQYYWKKHLVALSLKTLEMQWRYKKKLVRLRCRSAVTLIYVRYTLNKRIDVTEGDGKDRIVGNKRDPSRLRPGGPGIKIFLCCQTQLS
jgi:hypothetical protein